MAINECEYLRATYTHPEIRKCLSPYYCEYERNNGGCHKYCDKPIENDLEKKVEEPKVL